MKQQQFVTLERVEQVTVAVLTEATQEELLLQPPDVIAKVGQLVQRSGASYRWPS